MHAVEQNRLSVVIGHVPQAVAAAAAAVGVLVLTGWLSGIDMLKSVIPGLTFMKANTAVGFILSAVALWGSQAGGEPLQAIARTCAGLVLLLALLTLGEYLSGTALGIDQLLFRETTHLPGDIPGRMAVNTAISFAAVGTALLLLNFGKSGLVAVIHALALTPILLGGSAAIAYGYSIEEFLREKLNYTPMSLPAAAAFVLLAMGIVTARPDYPLRRFITSGSAAGVIVRSLLPAAIAFTLAAGWLMLQAYRGGYLSETLVLALFTAVSITGLSALILWNAGMLYEEAMQRERAEQERSAAAQYARSLIEASLDPLVTISADGKVTDVNEATVKATGVAREALVGSDFSGYFTEPGKARAGYQEVFAKGSVTDYPLTLRHVSGKVMEVLYNASVYRNDKGEVAGVFAAARDITEQKRAEELLEQGRNLIQQIIDNTPSLVYALDTEGRFIFVNKRFASLFKLDRRQLVGNTREYIGMPGHIIEEHRNNDLEIIRTLKTSEFEERNVEADGEHVYMSQKFPLLDSDERCFGVCGVSTDITERKRMEEQLRTASLYARSLIEASLDPLVTISADGKITDVNDATIRAIGMPRRALIGTDFCDYFTEPDKARSGYEEVFAKGYVTDYPLRLRHASGSVMEVLYNASVYRNEKGEVAGMFAAARDVTERKRAEQELRLHHERLEDMVRERTNELQSANHDLEELVYSVAHDLGIPLRAINGFSHLLLTEYADRLDDEGRRYLNVVRDHTTRMGQMIDGILAFSHSRSKEMTMSEIDMEALARGVFAELKAAVEGRAVELKIKQLPHCRGDAEMLRQVWVNLLSNAIKFTRLKTPAMIEVGGHTEGEEDIYYVKDNGAGFDMQYAEKLFGVFRRLHGVKEFEGPGIGLAIVKRIIARHGGRVWAEGRINEGATFYFALPREKAGRGGTQ